MLATSGRDVVPANGVQEVESSNLSTQTKKDSVQWEAVFLLSLNDLEREWGDNMVVGIIGESCTGKSTLANKLKCILEAEVYTGRDYLRLAKNETLAKKRFCAKLDEAVSGPNIIYVISEKEHLPLLPKKALRILVTAELDTIKERFARRMRGNLPLSVAAMLEKKHGCFDDEAHDIHMVSCQDDLEKICVSVQRMINARRV